MINSKIKIPLTGPNQDMEIKQAAMHTAPCLILTQPTIIKTLLTDFKTY